MLRRNVLILTLFAFILASCGGGAAPATEAPAATQAPAMAQPEESFISKEAVTTADAQLYSRLSNPISAPANRIKLAVDILGVTPDKIPTAPSQPATPYQPGDVHMFWVQDGETFAYKQITAQLMYVSNHAYFWQDLNSRALNSANTDATEADWKSAGEIFDHSYERVRNLFGSEESLGLDGDARLFVIHSDAVGKRGGYFNLIDQLPAVVEPYSNQGQFFFISNSWSTGISSEYYNEILVHEYQHMIHAHVDADEEGWLNEGLSMLAQQVAGMSSDRWREDYFKAPDQSLWEWGNQNNDYGQTSMYLDYLYEQLGGEFVRLLASDAGNGIQSIDRTLKKINAPENADEFYMDALTAALQEINIDRHQAKPGAILGSVNQYGGADVLTFTGNGTYTFEFTGDQRAKLLPTESFSGNGFWWSNRNDSSFVTLTRRVNLANVSTATLKYNTWYDLETDRDYAYLLVSTDNGVRWKSLRVSTSSSESPNNFNLGNGVTGSSGSGWIQESINLNEYTGRQILIRFAVHTNHLVSRFGFAVDDISIPEINWKDDMEGGQKDWMPLGFVQAHNRIPQIWGLRTVEQFKDGTVKINDLKVQNGYAEFPVRFDELKQLVVFIVGQTRYTTMPANYQINITN